MGVVRPDSTPGHVTLRPGILCLVNDVDWEIEGGLDYSISDQDSITFISSLHGG